MPENSAAGDAHMAADAGAVVAAIDDEIVALRFGADGAVDRGGEEFVVGGFTAPRGSRAYLGALLLGAYRGNELHFVGKVGAGFSERTLASLARMLRPLVRSKPAFVDPPREKSATWVEPRLVAQVAFQEWTADQKLRQPVFLGIRDDKKPREVVLPEPA